MSLFTFLSIIFFVFFVFFSQTTPPLKRCEAKGIIPPPLQNALKTRFYILRSLFSNPKIALKKLRFWGLYDWHL